MKTKKLISVFLAAVMLIVPMAFAVNAAPAYTIVQEPIKTVYTDSDYFVPQGLKISDGTNTIEYSPADDKWQFDPALNELLKVNENETGVVSPVAVRVLYNNKFVSEVMVTVNHTKGDLVSFGEKLEHGHGHYCKGCGKVLDKEDHVVTDWVPNDDKGFFLLQTESGRCTVCGQLVTRDIPDSEGFLDIFDFNGPMTPTESKIINMFRTIVVTLIQSMVGIK